jgi:uncharacterized protein involved in exopolysaccharide biosynthesis
MNPETETDLTEEVTSDEFDVRPYIWSLWAGRWIVVATLIAGAILGYAFSYTQPVLYNGRVVLLISQSKMGTQQAMPAAFPAGFSMLLNNASLFDRLLHDLKLDQPPYNMNTRQLVRRMSIEDVRGAPLVRAVVQLEDPKMAATFANEFARRAVELNQSINQHDTIQGRDLIKSQLDQAKTSLDRTEAELLAFKKQAQVELSKRDVESMLDKRGELLELHVDIEGERSKLAEAEKQRAQQAQVLPAQRQPLAELDLLHAGSDSSSAPAPEQEERQPRDGDPAWKNRQTSRESRDQREARVSRQTPDLPLGGGVVNPVWQLLEYQIANSRNRLQALERERQLLQTDLKLDAVRMTKLDQLYQSEVQITRLELERTIAAKVYSDLAAEYEDARLKVASRSAELQIIDPAIPLYEPTSPRRFFSLVLGAMLGFIGAVSVLSLRYGLSETA